MSSQACSASLLPTTREHCREPLKDVMTCCTAAICAVVRHSVSSPLPVLGCSALSRHCVMHAWALRAVTVQHALPPHAQEHIHRAAHRHDHCVAV